MSTTSSTSFLQIVVAIFLPFVAVFLHEGITTRFWICVVLSLFGYVPGVIYALYVITR